MHPRNQRLRRNNFDLLRFLFAGTVCLVHTYELSRFTELQWVSLVLDSGVAVKGFFVISGFLIFMSAERSSSLISYTSKRVRRIYPAYFTVVVLCALGLLAVSSHAPEGYFSFEWFRYLGTNLVFLNFFQQSLPGVFESNFIPAVNGALWTLKIEVMFYVIVPVFVFLFRRFTCLPILLLVYCLSAAYYEILQFYADSTGREIFAQLGRQLPGQLSYFMAGAFFYYFLPIFEKNVSYFLVAAVGIVIVNLFYPLPFLLPFSIATLVVFFGLFLYLGNFGKYGDFSYGIYILHYPIIQVLLNLGGLNSQPFLFFLTAIILTLVGSVLMWHLVEKRFLLRSSHYVKATVQPS